MPSALTVFYPFHPLAGQTLRVIAWPRLQDGAVTVDHRDGSTLKIPMWMLQPRAARFAVCDQTVLSREALAGLVDLLAVQDFSVAVIGPENGHAANALSLRDANSKDASPTPLARTTAAARGTDGAGHRGRLTSRSGRRS
jgi:hypothetical protein